MALIGLACLSVWPKFSDPVRWTPDGMYYEARVLEFRGTPHDTAMRETFGGPISAELRARDPSHSGNAEWVRFNEPFYQRRASVPLVAAAVYPLSGSRSLLYVSLIGYVASILAVFGLLLLRFRLAIAALVAAATVFLSPLIDHSSLPQTDSWGVALEIVAFAAALLALRRGWRWLPLWIGVIVLLSFTRDSTWIPVLAVGWIAVRSRARLPVTLFLTGFAAALPDILMFTVPVHDLLALLVNNSNVPSDTSWAFIARNYPGAVVELVRSNVGYLRRGEWYTAFYLIGGVIAMLFLVRRRPSDRTLSSLLTAGVVIGLFYVLAAPVFSAFRLELVFVPMAAFGLAFALELAAERASEHTGVFDRLAVRAPVRRS